MANEASAEQGGNTSKGSNASHTEPKRAQSPQRPRSGSSGLELVLMRNNFYRDNYRKLMVICLILLFIMTGMLGLLYYMYMARPTPEYFATTPEGALFKMEPLNRPFLSERTLNQWAVEAAVASYTLDFVHYRESLQEAKAYYTNEGYAQLLKAFAESRNLEAIKEKKLVASAVATAAPVIVERGISEGIYYWKLQLPMKVTYQSANELIPQNIISTMTIVRVPVWESAKGIGISSIVVREGRVQP